VKIDADFTQALCASLLDQPNRLKLVLARRPPGMLAPFDRDRGGAAPNRALEHPGYSRLTTEKGRARKNAPLLVFIPAARGGRIHSDQIGKSSCPDAAGKADRLTSLQAAI
jgi:hypothetical protein